MKCPKHNIQLREIEDYPGALVHDGCPEVFTIIDNQLCILNGPIWIDTKTGKERKAKED